MREESPGSTPRKRLWTAIGLPFGKRPTETSLLVLGLLICRVHSNINVESPKDTGLGRFPVRHPSRGGVLQGEPKEESGTALARGITDRGRPTPSNVPAVESQIQQPVRWRHSAARNRVPPPLLAPRRLPAGLASMCSLGRLGEAAGRLVGVQRLSIIRAV